MKTIYSIFTWALLVVITGSACSGPAQVPATPQDVANLIQSKDYVFIAQSVSPLGGRFRQLNTTEYDVRVLGDSVVAYLPYFGRAYSAPVDPTRGGIQFTSTNFEYSQADRNRGGWNISIEPKDATDVRQLTLTVTEKGSASLQVISNNRQSISFNGYIAARR